MKKMRLIYLLNISLGQRLVFQIRCWLEMERVNYHFLARSYMSTNILDTGGTRNIWYKLCVFFNCCQCIFNTSNTNFKTWGCREISNVLLFFHCAVRCVSEIFLWHDQYALQVQNINRNETLRPFFLFSTRFKFRQAQHASAVDEASDDSGMVCPDSIVKLLHRRRVDWGKHPMLAAGFAHHHDGWVKHCWGGKWQYAPQVVVVSNTIYCASVM